jgi:hypothetical protein
MSSERLLARGVMRAISHVASKLNCNGHFGVGSKSTGQCSTWHGERCDTRRLPAIGARTSFPPDTSGMSMLCKILPE